MNNTKNDKAWEQIFLKYEILKKIVYEGQFVINASQIKEFREPRLMTKFDHKSQLPRIFTDNQLCILPISRGKYILSNFEAYHSVQSNQRVEMIKIDFPPYIESIAYKNITSEATAINCAYIAGILDDFTEEENLKLTVSGRMSSSAFDFSIKKQDDEWPIKVINAQLEIDGGFEGIQSLHLIEAKNFLSNDFLIRQLYYPYRLWSQKVQKKVRNIYMTYTNGIFHFREYDFTNPNCYNSLQLIKEKKYLIREEKITLTTIQQLQKKTAIVFEPSIPFPQADSFERIINLCELLYEKKVLSREQITQNYDFDARQTDYYTNAGVYLNLVEKENKSGQIIYKLSPSGTNVFELNIVERQLRFAELILAHQAFNRTLALYFKKYERPTKQEVVGIMKTSNLYKVGSDSTFNRRASTIIKWVDWVLDLVEE